ncbi:MAG: PhzF family phenazine biosynthesis protein [Deltaproteobacteria bacterium]
MSIEIFQVDAFAEKPFTGNPAAVCILERPADPVWMQKLAAEMNLSETAFLSPRGGGFNLRWFTPTTEVELCGHATLAAAHVLWESGCLEPDKRAEFYTESGVLTASKTGKLIELDFPSEPETEIRTLPLLEEALGIDARYVGKNRFDYLMEAGSEEIVRKLDPDFNLLREIPARGVIVTSVSGSPEYDIVSRFFAPASGIDEDPVTGSAHCCLGPYWMKKLGKKEFTAFQASPRGGVVHVRVNGGRVVLGGKAVIVFKGVVLA